ncbi:hypothetical protein FC756_24010 [Lysinibacillus mangiferihumi]|uniref:Uncharacterized protein n=1 Tax=Lysinibacillus mangiferihumi TaxID=1130819 RepID=A0A4U2Y0F5_9BACI|nr:immunity 22 family protein [Lysinibacillus mangiferihumi]TKI53414.1 hypothetical protein FC756_24010 [Lysinibacillus mangiferihumi]
MSNAQLNKIVKDNFVKETSRTRTFTSDTMPGSNEYPTSSLSELLKNVSYSDSLISEFEDFYGENLEEQYNIVIRLYDFEYEKLVEEAKLDGRDLKYMGSVIYED